MAGGRPPGYKAEFAEQARKLCELAATDADLADFFKVHTATIYRWANKYPEFCEALKVGKSVCDERVERSLYHRAVGYTFDSEKVFQFQGKIVRAAVREHVPPDTTAQIFWLKNRRKDRWRDRHEHEVGAVGDFDRMSDDELRDFIAREADALGISSEDAARERGKGPSRGKPSRVH